MAKKSTTKKPALPRRYQSPDIPMSAIRRYARQIAERFQPEKIILFGSYAYGEPDADSDVDILVIMPARNEIDQACKIGRAFPVPFPLDLIVRKPKEVERCFEDEDWFLQDIVAQGKVLYEKKDSRVGGKS